MIKYYKNYKVHNIDLLKIGKKHKIKIIKEQLKVKPKYE